MKQKWFSTKPKKQFGPKRVAYNNKNHLTMEYRFVWIQWFALGGALAWPLATRVGKWAQTTPGGVALTPNPRYCDEWPNIHATKTTKKLFRRWSLATCFVSGFCLAHYMTDTGALSNKEY